MEVRMASSSNFLVTSMEMHEKAILQRQELGNRIKFAIPSLFASSAHCSARSLLQMNLSVEMASPIVSLSSPTHPQLQVALHSEIDAKEIFRGTAHLSLPQAYLDKDFFLFVEVENPHEIRGWKVSFPVPVDQNNSHSEKTLNNAVMIALCPDLSTVSQEDTTLITNDDKLKPQQEIIFVVDQSGSMYGSKIQSLKDCLNIVIRSLPPHTTLFNLVSFGSSYKILFRDEGGRPVSRPLIQQTFDEVSKYISNISADMGGTNILSALTAVLEGESSGQSNGPKNASCPRQLFILSDGVMDNKTVDILDLLRKHSDNMTAFTFGIGGDVDEECIKSMARAMRGSAELISDRHALETSTARQLARAIRPAWKDVKINWKVANLESDEKENDTEYEMEGIDDPMELEEYPKEWMCPITEELMDDPVVTSCGHMYDRSAIMHWLTKGLLAATAYCPICRSALSEKDLFPCYPIKSAIQERRKASKGQLSSNGKQNSEAKLVYQAPFRPPPVFKDDTLVVYGILSPSEVENGVVEITANGPQGGLKELVRLREPSLKVEALLHRLAVRALVKDYQQENSIWHERFASLRSSCHGSAHITTLQQYAKPEMLNLALLYSVVSPFTTLHVAGQNLSVEENVTATSQHPAPQQQQFTSYSPGYAPTSPSYSPTSPCWQPRASPQYCVEWSAADGGSFPIDTTGSFLSSPSTSSPFRPSAQPSYCPTTPPFNKTTTVAPQYSPSSPKYIPGATVPFDTNFSYCPTTPPFIRTTTVPVLYSPTSPKYIPTDTDATVPPNSSTATSPPYSNATTTASHYCPSSPAYYPHTAHDTLHSRSEKEQTFYKIIELQRFDGSWPAQTLASVSAIKEYVDPLMSLTKAHFEEMEGIRWRMDKKELQVVAEEEEEEDDLPPSNLSTRGNETAPAVKKEADDREETSSSSSSAFSSSGFACFIGNGEQNEEEEKEVKEVNVVKGGGDESMVRHSLDWVEAVSVTAAVLIVLRRDHKEKFVVWELLVAKAWQWLTDVLGFSSVQATKDFILLNV